MRRAALRGCALLLRRSGSAEAAANEPAALLATGLAAAAARGQRVGRQLWGPWLQAPLHAAAPSWRQADSDGSNGSPDGIEWVAKSTSGNRGKLVPVRPELAAELRPLAALVDVAAEVLAPKVASLGPTRERGVVEHGAAVAELLLGLGVKRAQLAELLLRCPYLFSFSAGERAAVLFSQLARLELTAQQAACCFQQHPSAAGIPSFEPAIAVLLPLLAAGSKAGSKRSGEQLLGDFLRKQPAAVGLLQLQPSLLQQRISFLVQRYGPHWGVTRQGTVNKHAVLVTAMGKQRSWSLLCRSPEHLLALEAALQQEVGQQPGDGTRLLAHIVRYTARTADRSVRSMRHRAQALVEEFGREPLLRASARPVAAALGSTSATWQVALAVWRLLGVADPAAVATRNLKLVAADWLEPARLAALTALQRLLPWQPAAADVVQQFATYVAMAGSERVIGRLLFLQQEGALPLLVANKTAAKQQWRRQRRLQAEQPADEPPFISLRDAVTETDAEFFALLEQLEAVQPKQSGTDSDSSSTSIAGRYGAFMERLPQLPAYQQLLAAGEAESRRLTKLLPPELAAAAAAARAPSNLARSA